MKTFKLLSLIPILLACASCMGEINPEEALIGRWKLVKGETFFFEPRTVDYSSKDIVYHFHPDGTLTVSGDSEDQLGYAAGDYVYELRPFPAFNGHDMDYTLQIGGGSWGCSISRSHLTLNNAPLDGPVLSFVKL